MKQLEYLILLNSTLTEGINESDILDIKLMSGYCVQAKWSNQVLLTGTIKLQGSNNKSIWNDIAGAKKTLSGDGSDMWNVQFQYYRYVKCVVEITSGHADFFVDFNSKDA